MRLVENNKVDNDIINNLLDEAFNPENEEKNKIIRQALRGPKSFEKHRKDLKDIGIKADRSEEYGYEPGETIYLRGKNGRQLSVDPDGTSVWNTLGDGEKHYKKELNFRNRHSKNYNNQEHLDFNGERGKSFDYYNYLNKPENEYQNEVDKANRAKRYSNNKGKAGYNLPDEALTPEEKSLNKRPRKYMQLKKDREELEKELSGYDETKKKLDKTNDEIKKLHEDSYDEIENKIKDKCNLIKNLLSHYGDGTEDVSYSGDYNKNKVLYYIWVRSGKFKAEDTSYYENDIDFDGRLYLDENLNFVKTDIKCASGPNLMNREFITALNALYTFVESNGDSYEG